MSLNILFTISEVASFAKTGGLADVGEALPKALKKLGHNVIVVMPRYYEINKDNLEHIPGALSVPMGKMGEFFAGVYKSFLPNSDVEIYFIDYEIFFGRKGLYTSEDGYSYGDNDKRFIFFSKACLELCKKIGFKVDILHANDWQTAAIPILKNTRYKDSFKDASSVLTIHNLQHQGYFPKDDMDVLEIGWEHFNPYEMEAFDAINILKGGIFHADAITTVSKKYAQEIQTKEGGFGLDEHIRAHNYKLYGILNGVDYTQWNPKRDRYIVKNYDVDDMSGKIECKKDLQEIFNLPKSSKPLIGFVGRLVQQKGIELIAQAMNDLLNLDAQYVLLGRGEKWAEGFFSDVARRFPDRFACYIGYSNELAHKIEAGSDLFLMPSLFEPCGLNQIYSLRYGTLPIVRATGGLDDTIENFDPFTKRGTGFKFWEASRNALFNTVKWAVDVWKNDKEAIKKMQQEGMRKRFSWENSAKEYEKVYERVKK